MKNIDGKDVERPISPHLQIYKPQITSVLSISHRLSGIFLGLGLVFSVFYVFFLALGEQSYNIWQCFSNSLIGNILLFLWLLALVFHALNGLRHLLWDIDVGMSLDYVKWSGIAVCIFSLVLSFILAILIWV